MFTGSTPTHSVTVEYNHEWTVCLCCSNNSNRVIRLPSTIILSFKLAFIFITHKRNYSFESWRQYLDEEVCED